MESIQPPACYVYWATGSDLLSRNEETGTWELSTRFYLVPKFRINAAALPFHHMSSWCGAKLRTGTIFRFLWPCIVSKVWREKNQQDATIRCLLLTSVSTCFGHHYAHLQENKGPVTAFGIYCSLTSGKTQILAMTSFFCGVVCNIASWVFECVPIHTQHSHTHTNSQLDLLHTNPTKKTSQLISTFSCLLQTNIHQMQ